MHALVGVFNKGENSFSLVETLQSETLTVSMVTTGMLCIAFLLNQHLCTASMLSPW